MNFFKKIKLNSGQTSAVLDSLVPVHQSFGNGHVGRLASVRDIVDDPKDVGKKLVGFVKKGKERSFTGLQAWNSKA